MPKASRSKSANSSNTCAEVTGWYDPEGTVRHTLISRKRGTHEATRQDHEPTVAYFVRRMRSLDWCSGNCCASNCPVRSSVRNCRAVDALTTGESSVNS